MKQAKWTLATSIQTYYRPQKDVFIKPSTTKLIIDKLELDLEYQAAPTWKFYSAYRKQIKAMKETVNKNLSPNSPAFCGFLMTALKDD